MTGATAAKRLRGDVHLSVGVETFIAFQHALSRTPACPLPP
ncbi:hypothetical protein [Paraburkholderia guartelaensis]|nr:hypothetical protein [Paraburkholderia guartelaensis]